MKTNLTVLLLAVAAAFGLAGTASATTTTTYGFDCISDNPQSNCAWGEQYFTMTVVDGGGQVTFWINNGSPTPADGKGSSIGEIYFDFTPDAVFDWFTFVGYEEKETAAGLGVNYVLGTETNQGNLPAGQKISFVASTWYDPANGPGTDPYTSGEYWNGINPGEALGITFSYTGYASLPMDNIRVGIHARDLAPGLGSESFVNGDPIPEPASGALLLAGIGMLAARARARRRRQQ